MAEHNSTAGKDAPGYYVDRVDDMGDLYACAACVKQHGLSTANPVSPEVMKYAPLRCGIHTYGANPKEYR